MLVLPPVVLVITAAALITRLLKFFVLAPLIDPAPPVNGIVEVPPSIVPPLVTRLLPMVVEVAPNEVVAPALFNVRLKKVVFPVSVWIPELPSNVTVALRGVNVPLLVQFPASLILKLVALASSVVLAPMLTRVATLMLPASVLVPDPDVSKLPYFCALFSVATVWLEPE